MEAVPDHEQDGQQQDADVRQVPRVDLHRDRLASNGAPASGQSRRTTILSKHQKPLSPFGIACEHKLPYPKETGTLALFPKSYLGEPQGVG